MSWFKPRPPSICVPFPADRIAALSTIIPGAVFRGLKLRNKEAISPDEIWRSSFINTYLCGFPRYLEEELDPRTGGPIRFGLLKSILSCSDGEAQYRFDTFCSLMERQDSSTWEAFQLAKEDGEHYFKALIASIDTDEKATRNLVLAIRGYDIFPEMNIPD